MVSTVETYDAVAYRDGTWWTFEIPALNGPSPRGGRIVAMGQTRTVAELEDTAREVAALWLNVSEEKIAITVEITFPEDVARLLAASTERQEAGREAIKEAAQLKRHAVQALISRGISQRDAARILGVSTQRVNQLARREAVADRDLSAIH